MKMNKSDSVLKIEMQDFHTKLKPMAASFKVRKRLPKMDRGLIKNILKKKENDKHRKLKKTTKKHLTFFGRDFYRRHYTF